MLCCHPIFEPCWGVVFHVMTVACRVRRSLLRGLPRGAALRGIDAEKSSAHTPPRPKTGFNMSYLERAITDGHAKLTGDVDTGRIDLTPWRTPNI